MTLITNIQKYCIHDGRGIRTSVFFKGCPLRCKWCHNPETQLATKEIRHFQDRCIGCGSCQVACERQAIVLFEGRIQMQKSLCQGCIAQCIRACSQGAIESVGAEEGLKELVKNLCKDQIFYEESDGGVTLSGGEVMSVDMEYLKALVKSLCDRGISVNIDTCGYCSFDRFREILPYVDTFLYDFKVLDAKIHKAYTGVSNELILDNLRKLSQAGARLWVRIPVIKPVNASKEIIQEMGKWLLTEHICLEQINLMPYHDYGEDKYHQLGMDYEGEGFLAPSDAEMESYRQVLITLGFDHVKIGG